MTYIIIWASVLLVALAIINIVFIYKLGKIAKEIERGKEAAERSMYMPGGWV